jgi:hypothetical protein
MSVRFELISGQHAFCLLSVFEDALLAIPDGDARVLVSITHDPTHNECTLLSDFMPRCFPSPTRTLLVTGDDANSAQGLRYHGAKPAPPRPSLQPFALPLYTSTRPQAATMNPMVPFFEAGRGMLHFPRCAPTKPPEPLRADHLPRPTTTPCSTRETQGAQRLLFCIRVLLQGALVPSSPHRDYGDVHLFPRSPRFSPDHVAVARDAEIKTFISTVP